jgi:hypothetical protein
MKLDAGTAITLSNGKKYAILSIKRNYCLVATAEAPYKLELLESYTDEDGKIYVREYLGEDYQAIVEEFLEIDKLKEDIEGV